MTFSRAKGAIAAISAAGLATATAISALALGAAARQPSLPLASTASACLRAPGQGLTLAGIAANRSRLIVVGSDGLVATSSDPARWSVRRTPVQHALRGATWNGTRWIVVGDLGTILSSAGGGSWRIATGIPSVGLRAVAARPGLAVAAGAAGTVATSSNGVQWTVQNSGTNEILWGATHVGSTLLASGRDATVIASDDGSNWRAIPTRPRPTRVPIAPRPFLWQLASNGTQLTAVGDFGSILQGTLSALTGVHSPTGEILRGVVYGSHRVRVAVGSSGVILRSVAGGRWRLVDAPTTVDLRAVAYTGSRFVAAGDEGTIVSSRDGRSWRLDTTAMPCALLGVARGAGRFIAVGGSGQLLSSANGRSWKRVVPPTGQDLYSIAHGPAGFVAVGARGTVLQSTDGKRWIARRLPARLNLHAVAWTGHGYVLGGDRGLLFSSASGRRWRAARFQHFHSIRDFATGDGTTVAVGAGTVARRSLTGTWKLETVGLGRFQTSVAFGRGRFVVVGHNGEALVSTDGARTWAAATTGAAVNLDRVVYAQGRFIATGEGVALSSTDGLHWSTLRLPTVPSIRAIAVDGSLLIAVGDEHTILRSTDGGVRWSKIS